MVELDLAPQQNSILLVAVETVVRADGLNAHLNQLFDDQVLLLVVCFRSVRLVTVHVVRVGLAMVLGRVERLLSGADEAGERHLVE